MTAHHAARDRSQASHERHAGVTGRHPSVMRPSWSELKKFTAVEAKLFFRDPAAWIVALVLPTGILLILGSLPGLRTPDESFGGQRFIDVFAPSLLVVTLTTLGLNAMPTRLAAYRDKGVLRRLSTTPVHAGTLLIAQLVVYLGVAIAALVLLVVVGKLTFDVPLPRDMPGFIGAYLVGITSLLALGLLVAAVAPTTPAGTALGLPLYFLTMFLGGVYLPRVFLPDFLIRIGAFTPPGVQALSDAWLGSAPQLPQLATMLAITLVAGVTAVRAFRWQ
jgi:ABC-2 type transport system permease protein